MSRIDGADPERSEGRIRAVLEAQAKKWGGPLLNHLVYARRPTIFQGARAMWGGWTPRAWWNPPSSPSSTAGSPP